MIAKSKIPTPHISASKKQIAKRILMPGDPKRAKWIAQKFLKNAKLVSDVRGMSAYTGTYKNVPVTVMAHGMGIPSILIYTHELYAFYGAKVIYRIGSCGSINASKVKLGDVVVASSCYSDIPINPWTSIKTDGKNIFKPTKSSLDNIIKTAKKHKIDIKVKPAISSTFFYTDMSHAKQTKLTGSTIYEMEGFGLFLEAKRNKAKAACLLTVSDNMDTHDELTSLERQTTFVNMAKLSLEAIIKEKV